MTMRCIFCGEEIDKKDREAIWFYISSANSDNCNIGYICGECVMTEQMYKLWREGKE